MPEDTPAPQLVCAISEAKANLRLMRQALNHYLVTVPAETKPEEVLQPAFWKHLAQRLKKDWENNGTIDIRVVSVDRSWRWELEVRDVGPYHVTVKPISDICHYDFGGSYGAVTPVEAGEPKNILVRYTPGAGWIVQRVSDKEMLAKGLKNRDVAETWLTNYLKSIAA